MTDPAPAVEIRPAATLMLIHDGVDGMEVLMLRRHPDSIFAADAWVFPGGALDPADGELPGSAVLGATDGDASATIGVPSGGLAYFVAAIRECFEEAGVLLARHAGRAVLDTSSDLDATRFARYRRDLLAGRRSLAQVLNAEKLVLDLTDVFYVSHLDHPAGSAATLRHPVLRGRRAPRAGRHARHRRDGGVGLDHPRPSPGTAPPRVRSTWSTPPSRTWRP